MDVEGYSDIKGYIIFAGFKTKHKKCANCVLFAIITLIAMV